MCSYDNGTCKITTVKTLDSFVEYCKPHTATIGYMASKITGITNKSLELRQSIGPIYHKLIEHIDTQCMPISVPRVMFGHNILNFDFRIMAAEADRLECLRASHLFRRMRVETICDTLPMAKLVMNTTNLRRRPNGKASYKLGDIYMSKTGKKLEGAHDALVDSIAVMEIIMADTHMQMAVGTLIRDLVGKSNTDNHVKLCKFSHNPMKLVTEFRKLNSKHECKTKNTIKRMFEQQKPATNKRARE